MSEPIQFRPAHPQPFTLEQAMQLEVNILVTEISRLRNSIAHLQRTQEELRSFLQEEPGDQDITLAIQENDGTLASQRERIGLIKVALINKVGKEGLKHYGLGLDGDVEGSSGKVEGDQRARPGERPASTAGEDDGLHL